MKRLSLCLLMSMLLCGALNSQISLLLEGGANYGRTAISGVDNLSQENITSYYFSVTPKLPLLSKLCAFTEVQFSREGANLDFDGPGDVQTHRVYYFRLIPGVELDIVGPLSLLAGFNVGFLTIENLDGRVLNGPSGGGFNLYERTDYGVLLGVNLNFGGFNLAVKYNMGFKDVLDINFTDLEGNIFPSDSRNQFLQVGVGYEFGF